MEKENNSDESDFSKNEIPDLNSLKPFKFEPKTNIGDIISSSSDDEDEGVEYKVKPISNNEWCESVQKQSLADALQNRCQACNFIKKGLQYRCCQACNFIKKGLQCRRFPMKFTKSLRTPFFTEQLYSDGCFWQ